MENDANMGTIGYFEFLIKVVIASAAADAPGNLQQNGGDYFVGHPLRRTILQ